MKDFLIDLAAMWAAMWALWWVIGWLVAHPLVLVTVVSAVSYYIYNEEVHIR